ncbi:xanthine dehydrogenase family protein molybdopterin-binding subunit [Ornithinimicrobium pratense]|uniref:Xanthine dehydrogenase family protein molybdopterin-binding subunit n=1 Tax=Ornithinimicrobium pratense TaxID=2593973 RepID=A0A5J6V2Y1_9MICO|nr:xanthine dehydrogenase family protein molybdopterin-binding subunit [Ornithinimicrobium pratense]QFG68280.1 xanthine dehydrogenase family protein molybdopterin-binding subunit [Ornithinimicrobium pratense]
MTSAESILSTRGSILGTEVRRVEDPDLLLGRGRFVDNIDLGDEQVLCAVFVRSPIAHALVTGIDTAEALAAPGVVAVLTAQDMGLDPVPLFAQINKRVVRHPLAVDRVRFVGDPVALVVARTRAQAVDAAELVVVDYEELPAVVDMEEALADDAPLQHPELGTNVALAVKDPDGDVDVLQGAQRVVRLRMENNRMATSPIEGHAILVRPVLAEGEAQGGEGGGRDEVRGLDVWLASQHPHVARKLIGQWTGLEDEAVRVRAPHVGGAFGGKAGMVAEHGAVIRAAQRLGRPVRWAETRSETMLSMSSRGQVQYVELGLDEQARISGLRARVVGDCGAHAGYGGSYASGSTRTMSEGSYRIPRLRYDALSVMTNTAPTGAFRGAGRPEAAAMLERIMDHAAREIGLAPEELRRRNFLAPEDFPHETKFGARYDTGDYAKALDAALEAAGVEQVRAEQARRREAGESLQLGVGIASYVEITGFGGKEYAGIRVAADGHLTVMAGTSAHGQGHATTFSMLVADQLGLPLERISYVQSDTAVVRSGGGTGGARSVQLGGSAVLGAAVELREQATQVAADLLEVAVQDVELVAGHFGVRGVPGSGVTWEQVAAQAHETGDGLSVDHDFRQDGATFPFGTHVCVVEVDVETGHVQLLRHVAVDDCGTVINPLLVRGQQQGGTVQGISQALWEEFRYDESGQPITSTFADYLLPSTADVVQLDTRLTATPTDRNPLGAKGIGEAATVGSTPAVQNAVVDAVAHLGVRHIDLPCTPERVWAAIQEAARGQHEPWREPPVIFEDIPDFDAQDDVEV